MHITLSPSSPPLRRASPLAYVLALALAAPGCVVEITDFKESASTATTEVIEDTTTGSATSEGVTSDSSTSVASTTTQGTTTANPTTTTLDSATTEDVTTNATTSTPEDFPACHAYTLDPESGDAEACAAELGCADAMSAEDCTSSGYLNEETEQAVWCGWGDILRDGVYIEDEQICDGNLTHVCVAHTFLGDGGPPCAGFYHDFGGTIEVLNLDCGTPIAGDWEPCYVDGDDPVFPACNDCFPQLP
jgi:hypothetical protein